IAPGARPPLKWSEQENIRWKTKIPGEGFSTPIIWKDRIFLLTAIDTGADSARSTGGPQPPQEPPGPPGKKGKKGGGSGPGPHATTIHEWAVLAIDRGSGKIAWQKVARREVPHEGHHPTHGFASASPVTDGEFLYASFGSRGLYCYDFQGNLK